MNSRSAVWLLLAATLALPARAAERNAWPFWVGQEDERTGEVTAAQALGPLLVQRTGEAGAETQVWRPFFLWQKTAAGEQGHVLYPLLSWQRTGEHDASFSLFRLVNSRRTTAADGAATGGFDVWPFYFSRATGAADTSYRAVFPLSGTIKHRFGKDELTWRLFPLYAHVTARGGRETTHAPWPFVRLIDGNGHHGFELWPLAGSRGREGDYRQQFALWPLLYRQERTREDGVHASVGVLPFYTRDTAPGYRNENYLWPFFGHTERTAPTAQAYRETRYFWPFLVQGRGETRHVNRWAPFYTHSVAKGYDKTWLLWPLYRRGAWQGEGVAQERHQFLVFLYWANVQRSLANPDAAPAYKKHLWPLVSVWDNGAGRRQLQLLSPLEIFFPHDDPVRQLYTPLFALYRYDQRAPDDVRWSFLWSAVTRRRTAQESEFHLGPLYGAQHTAQGSRITLGAGLLSWRRAAGERRWQFSIFDFSRPNATPGAAASSP